MRNFTYRSLEERENLEAILKRRKRKVNRQQIVAGIIAFVIATTFILYVAFHTYYTEYDGYVHVDANRIRTPFDIYLDSVYVKTGDVVAPGDTLYSYYIIDVLLEHSNPNTEPVIVGRNRDLTLRYQTLSQQIGVLRVQIAELRKQIEVEDHNIGFGLSGNSHKLDLERELQETIAKLRAAMGELGVLGRMRNETSPGFISYNRGGRGHQQIYDDISSNQMLESVRYHLASDSAIITNVMAPDRMVFFEKEELMTTQHIDLEGNNLQIVAYVPVDKMNRIDNHSRAEIVVNSEFQFGGHVEVLGMRTSEIPENLRSYFSKKNTAVIAILKFDEGQTLPLWCMAQGLPVRVRIRNLDTWRREPSSFTYLWYTIGKGLRTNLPDAWTYDEAANEAASDTNFNKVVHEQLHLSPVKPLPEGTVTSKEAHEKSKAEAAGKKTAKTDRQVSEKIRRADTVKSAPAEKEVKKGSDAVKNEAKQTEKTISRKTGTYYVIVGSLKSREKAEKELVRLKKKFPNVDLELIDIGRRLLISVSSHTTLADAKKSCKGLSRSGVKGAWIYEQKN